MESRTSTALTFVTLLLCNHLLLAHGFDSDAKLGCACCGLCLGVVSAFWGIGQVVYKAYEVYKSVMWARDFAEYLERSRSHVEISQVQNWLLHNPPPFAEDYYWLLKIVAHILDSKTLLIFKKHGHLKNMSCGHAYCKASKEFIRSVEL